MFVNITQASKLAGISRETLYKNYINKGKISISRDSRDRPVIETSELLRVFGALQGVRLTPTDTQQTLQHLTPEKTPDTQDLQAKIAHLQAENAQLKERLTEAKEREDWHKDKIDTLMDTVKLLEAPKKDPPKASFFARLFGQK